VRRFLCVAAMLVAVDAAAQADIDATLQRARDLIYTSGDYDGAVRLLREEVDWQRPPDAKLREAYLLLIDSIVYLGNANVADPGGYSTAQILYDEARTTIAQCLRIKELRQTRPEPDSLFAPETKRLFTEVRQQTLGGFVVRDLQPEDAVVTLDGDTLRALPGETGRGDLDLMAGVHSVVIQRHGYAEYVEELRVQPGVTTTRDYVLKKHRGWSWYATRVTGLAVVTGGIVALVAGGGEETPPAAEPLPAAPPPPGR
jgi:PEGA domain-containing protein